MFLFECLFGIFHAGVCFLVLYCGFMFLLASPLTPVSVIWTLYEWNVLLVIAGRVRQVFVPPKNIYWDVSVHCLYKNKQNKILCFVFSFSRQEVTSDGDTLDSCLRSLFSWSFLGLWDASSIPFRCTRLLYYLNCIDVHFFSIYS